MNVYTWADEQINTAPKYNSGFTQLLGKYPYYIESNDWNIVISRNVKIREFMRISLDIFKNVLNNDTDQQIRNWLLNETPDNISLNYHRSLKEQHLSLPVFFRTDESSLGKIVEIDCPGSLWGELQLVYENTFINGIENKNKSPAKLFSNQLYNYLKKQPIIHYLLDSAMVQPGMRYFIEKTRPELLYAHIDKGIWPKNCNFIRNHFFYGLCHDVYFEERFPRIGIECFFDLPPHVLFSQKATLVLPFWSKTKKLFTDEIRNIINYSVPLLPTGIELENGLVSIDDFCNLPRGKRGYMLKYAGSNGSINWGSKGVIRLNEINSNNCRVLLKNCLNEYNLGKIWLLQKEDKQKDNIVYLDRELNEINSTLHLKLSSFYSHETCIGILAMHSKRPIVHGQNDTVISYVMPKEI